ncbi:MAG: hypothetical protein HKO57_15630, partial [Akkermansiaceae bacterium]|nr:hypothetical protein [Akkermansiaceae bacterium]
MSILVLLALVAVGLLTLSTLSVRSANLDAAQSEARANARLALILALGELQKTMGPDMRVSARAETLAQDARLNATVPPNTAKAWWVGASPSDPAEGIGRDRRPVVWLVSGLDPKISPQGQISAPQPFAEPVDMFGDQTIDTAALTGGAPIQAGSVMIANHSGRNAGGFAYFIDDDGMKAQLAAANPEVRNNRGNPLGGGVLPGTYDLGRLDGMEALTGRPLADYNKLLSIRDLPLIGADTGIARAKRLGYTTLSRGVLSDVRQGGLKRDLTIAFERENVFNTVFAKDKNGFGSRYIVMDEEKLRVSRDLQENGYIHWEMFKDFYNIKKHIKKKGGRGGSEYLDAIMITKEGLFNREANRFKQGTLGPHAIGPNSDVSPFHRKMPYGDYSVIAPPSKTGEYKHSPVIPILSRMQQNAWVEHRPQPGRQPDRIRTNVQLWKSQYNAYNIGLNIVGDDPRFGPRIIHYPQVYFTIEGMRVKNAVGGAETSMANKPGFSGKRQSSVPREILLSPGRSRVFAFKDYGTIGRDNDEFLYDDKVKDLTLQSIYREYQLVSAPRSMTLEVDFVLERPSMLHGANSNAYNASHEVSQTMWAPFAWEAIDGRHPGKTITKPDVSLRELNENTMASFLFQLRTTREGSGAIRPLIDGNIRALMCNTRWDSPLGVSLLASYSAENEGETEEQIFQMNTRDAPKGYTYWGAGHDPVDGHDRVILFDIPREDLVSLGQLQHAGVGRFSYEPSYVVGNSYANLRIPADRWKAT